MSLLKFASQLSDDNEYAIVWWGQSNATARGTQTDGQAEAAHLVNVAGAQLTITDFSAVTGAGAVITVAEALTVDFFIGAELRLIHCIYGNSEAPAHVGIATVTDNDATTLTVTWSEDGVVPSDSTGNSVAFASNKVTETAHGFENGDRVKFSGTVPVELSTSTVYYVAGKTANDFDISLTLGGAALTFTDEAAGATNYEVRIGAYVHFEERATYSNVRVLTPYLPEEIGDYPAGVPSAPDSTWPATITGYEYAARFLEFTWNEGVEGYGTTNTADSVDATTMTATGDFTANLYPGAYVRMGGSYAKVASNDANVLTLDSDGWIGGTPVAGTYEIHIPHYRDNAHHSSPGAGFRTPSNYTQPHYLGAALSPDGYVYNRPQGRLVPREVAVSGGLPLTRFGAMIEAAWKLSVLTGKRINVIPLAAVAAGFSRQVLTGGPDQIGWWDTDIRRDWMTGTDDSLAARLKQLVTLAAPAALTAEGSTKPLKILGLVGFQGETEAQSATHRALMQTYLSSFYGWLRRTIVDAGLSAYPDRVKIPVVHPNINPTFEAATILGFPSPNADLLGLINTAIDEWVAKDGSAATFDTDDSPVITLDPGHFDGEGEAINGDLAATALASLIDVAAAQSVEGSQAIRICNLALSHIGADPRVTAIMPSDGSTEADLCATYYETARDSLLQMHSWNFSAKHVALVSVTKDASRTEWDYAYALPSDLATVISVLPPESSGDYNALTYSPTTYPLISEPLLNVPGGYTPQPYTIEQDSTGVAVLYCRVDDAVMRYNATVNAGTPFPPNFEMALSWMLASMLAGPLIKGDEGARAGQRAMQMVGVYLNQSATIDSNQGQVDFDPSVPWLGL